MQTSIPDLHDTQFKLHRFGEVEYANPIQYMYFNSLSTFPWGRITWEEGVLMDTCIKGALTVPPVSHQHYPGTTCSNMMQFAGFCRVGFKTEACGKGADVLDELLMWLLCMLTPTCSNNRCASRSGLVILLLACWTQSRRECFKTRKHRRIVYIVC